MVTGAVERATCGYPQLTKIDADIYEALMAAGTPEEKTRVAAKSVAEFDVRLVAVGTRIDRLNARLDIIIWILGANLALSMTMLGTGSILSHQTK
jgi:hypothetical protein